MSYQIRPSKAPLLVLFNDNLSLKNRHYKGVGTMGEEHRQQIHDMLGPDFADAINAIPDYIFEGISDGEVIKLYTSGWDQTAGNPCVIVVTDGAIYLFRTSVFKKKFLGKETIRFGQITGIEVEKTPWNKNPTPGSEWNVIINRAGNINRIEHLNEETSTAMVNEVQQIMDSQNGSSPAPPQAAAADPMEKIQKLKEMLEAGLINEDEFNTKKAAILESM
jgi:hypothetical protein